MLHKLAKRDVIILREVNVDRATDLSINIDGFQSFNVCREGRRGGGILVFVCETLLVEEFECSFYHAEVLLLHLSKEKNSFTLVSLYRTPNNNMQLFFDEITNFLNRCNINNPIFLKGDINIDTMDTTKYGVTEYIDILSEFGLENHIKDYTREKPLGENITRSCLDHELLAGVIKTKISDHYFTTPEIFREKCVITTQEKKL